MSDYCRAFAFLRMWLRKQMRRLFRKQEERDAQVESDKRADKWNPEPELSNKQDGSGLHHADEDGGNRFTGHDLGRAEGSHQQLVEGPLLSFASDGHSRQEQRLQHGQS